jgi:hypothetical protein
MSLPDHPPAPAARHRDLESLATGVELTLASVLQGIPLATLIPQLVDLLLAGDIARLLYAPASLLIVFMVWLTFILYALSFITWPFDPYHNLLYFLIVCAEAVLLGLIDRPGAWFLALLGLGVALAVNTRYNQRTLARQAPLYTSVAEQALLAHTTSEQQESMRFAGAYIIAGVLGGSLVPFLEQIGLPQGLVWSVASLGALAVPLAHVIWLVRLIPVRSHMIEQAQPAA